MLRRLHHLRPLSCASRQAATRQSACRWMSSESTAEITDLAPKTSKKQQQPAKTTTWHKLLVGRIEAIEPHPAADTLNICQVSVGTEADNLQIICGAPNVRVGALVPVATIGSKLAMASPDQDDGIKMVKIKKSKLRGEVSQGMICSEEELGLCEKSDGIMILADDVAVGSLVQDAPTFRQRQVDN